MESAKVQKFVFDDLVLTHSNGRTSSVKQLIPARPTKEPEIQEEQPLPPPPPEAKTYSEADLAFARNEAAREAAEKIKAELNAKYQSEIETIKTDYEAKIAILSNLPQEFMQSLESLIEQMNEQEAQIADIALQIAGKIVDTSSMEDKAIKIRQILSDIFKQNRGEMEMDINFNPEMLKIIEKDLPKIAKDSGYKGKISLASKEDMNIYDIEIHWNNGRLIRSFEEIWQQLQNIFLLDKEDTKKSKTKKVA